MIVRTDHVAGGTVIVVGLVVWALSGDLPFGRLSMPGAGMLPKLVCSLMMLFGLLLILRAGDSAPLASLSWGDLGHAGPVFVITALATALYVTLGFIITFSLMLFGLLCIERRNLIAAAAYSIGVSVATYYLFSVVLKSPLEPGLLGF
jgi:tripartite tricarboxylate transporter TctB family protein